MTRRAECTPALAGIAFNPTTGTPDFLRRESFGGLYYSRSSCDLSVLTSELTDLLIEARDTSMLEILARRSGEIAASDTELAETVVGWQEQGLLTEDFRCRAQVIASDCQSLSAPLVTNIQLTRACNLRCTHCYVETMAKPAADELSRAEIAEVFSQLRALGAPLVVLAGGEPMLRRDFFDILEDVERLEMDAFLCTNGTLISDDNAARLASSALRGYSISLDGPEAETHDRLRGAGRFEHAVGGIRALTAAGARGVAIRVTVTSHNADCLLAFADLARNLELAKVVIKPFSQVAEASDATELTIDRESYYAAIDRAADAWPRDVPVDFGDGMPSRPPTWSGIIPPFGCVGGNTTVTVTHDAKVVACSSVLSDDDWSLRQHSFTDCWQRAPSIKSWRELEITGGCHDCEQFAGCGGGCRARALGVQRGIGDEDPWAGC